MSTLKTVSLQNPASGIVNATLNADGTTAFGGVITFATGQTFPNLVSSITAGTGLTGGTITSSGTIALDTAYTDTLYLSLTGGTMTGDITFSGTQTFPPQDLQTVTTAGAVTTDTITAGGMVAAGLTYPTADGAAGDYLSTDGAGALGWITPPVETLQSVTDNGAVTTNAIDVAGLTAAGLSYPTTDGAAGEVLTTDGAGNLGWVAGATIVAAPSASGDPGNAGEVAYDSTYFYWYDGANWQRVAADTTPW